MNIAISVRYIDIYFNFFFLITFIFLKVHLEINPSEFEADEPKFLILKQNDNIRHEIFADLLKNHLTLSVQSNKPTATNGTGPKLVFKNAYFLGRHEVCNLI